MNNIIDFPLSPEKRRDNERAVSYSRPYLEFLYAHFALNGCKYQWYDGEHEITKQVQLMGADVSLVCKQTHDIKYVDEKTDFHKPQNFCLEIFSNTVVRPNIAGWAWTSKVDRLVYSFVWLKDILDVFILDFPHLQQLLFTNENWRKIGKGYIVPDSPNRTYSRMVPTPQITEQVSAYRYLITRNGDMFNVPLSGQDPINIVSRVLNKHGVPLKCIA